MIKWFLDKQSKIPLYLQLKDSIKFSIFSGDIKENEHLPGVNVLAAELEINFDTVRKAYKELEKEGLVSLKKGRGTVVRPRQEWAGKKYGSKDSEKDLFEETKNFIKKVISEFKDITEAKRIINEAANEVASELAENYLICTGRNLALLSENISLLENILGLRVKPVALDQLKEEITLALKAPGRFLGILTTIFSLDDVRAIIGDAPVEVHLIVVTTSRETRKEIEAFNKNTRIGFVCAKPQNFFLFKYRVETEFPDKGKIIGCSLEDRQKLKELLESVDVVLVNPLVHEEVKKMAPPQVKVIDIFDQIDPMSVKIVKEKILSSVR